MVKNRRLLDPNMLEKHTIPAFLRLIEQQARSCRELEYAVAPDAYQMGIGADVEVEDVIRELLLRKLIESEDGRYKATEKGRTWLARSGEPRGNSI